MKRFLTAAVGILLMVPAFIFSDTVVFPALMTMLALIAVYEVFACTGVLKERAFLVPALLFALSPLVIWILDEQREITYFHYKALVAFCMIFAMLEIIICIVKAKAELVQPVFYTVSLVLYVVISFTCVVMLRRFGHGFHVLLMTFLCSWISDMSAYFVGKRFGRHKLAPAISPNKSIEGAVAGLIGTGIGSIIYGLILHYAFSVSVNFPVFVIVGILLSVAGQLGDLFASCIKRQAQIKDFGKIFPGHGGVLDRFDSTIAIADALFLLHGLIGFHIMF